MDSRASEGFGALTEKEKQTLRLIVRGHDIKSTARSLGLSVHTINERLRDARRKMAVSSSRAAARLLLEAEGGELGAATPELLGDAKIGGDASSFPTDRATAPIGARRAYRRPLIMGLLGMTFALAMLALAALPQATSSTSPSAATTTTETTVDPEVVDAARAWLTLNDQGRWRESYRATGAPFRKLNTARTWAAVSDKVRAPLGAVVSRAFLGQEYLPAPPAGYEVVKFRTSFANKIETLETVTLDREAGRWRVVGVTIG